MTKQMPKIGGRDLTQRFREMKTNQIHTISTGVDDIVLDSKWEKNLLQALETLFNECPIQRVTPSNGIMIILRHKILSHFYKIHTKIQKNQTINAMQMNQERNLS